MPAALGGHFFPKSMEKILLRPRSNRNSNNRATNNRHIFASSNGGAPEGNASTNARIVSLC
jgi:hypothetical protein